MKCHICGRDMIVIETEVIGSKDDVTHTVNETWFCQNCDKPPSKTSPVVIIRNIIITIVMIAIAIIVVYLGAYVVSIK